MSASRFSRRSPPTDGGLLPHRFPTQKAEACPDRLPRTQLPQHVISDDGSTTIFLFHGAYGAGSYWQPVTDLLVAHGYRVVVWDCPGYGGTPLPPDFSIDLAAERAAALISAVGGERNVVLGHSMGGLIAPLAAVRPGKRPDALVLSATTASFNAGDPEWREEFIKRRVMPILQGQPVADYAPALIRDMMAPGARGPLVDQAIEIIRAMSTETFRAAIEAIRGYDEDDVLARLDMPVLLIAGAHDGTCRPSDMTTMAERISNSTYVCLDDVGHFGWAERPVTYLHHVLQFPSANSL